MKRLDQTRIFRETFLAEKLGARLLMRGWRSLKKLLRSYQDGKNFNESFFKPQKHKKTEIILRNLSKSMYFKYGSI